MTDGTPSTSGSGPAPSDARVSALGLTIARLIAAGRHEAAAALCRNWIAADPASARPHELLAGIAAAQERWAEGLRHLDEALARAPGTQRYLVERGVLLRRLGDCDGSVSALEQALALAPESAGALGHLGLTLLKLDQDAAAKDRLERALAIDPAGMAWRFGLALIAGRAADADGAIALLGPVLAAKPNDVAAVELRAQMALDQGDYDGAIRWQSRAVALNPSSHEFAAKLALTQLQAGRLAEGWASLRSRMDVPGRDGRAGLFPQAFWTGESLRDRSIVLWRQFGVGDEILFAGMLPELLAEGGRAVVECDPRLLTLFERSFPAIRFVPFQGALATPRPEMLDPTIDFKAAHADLGARYRGSFDRFPSRPSYLQPDRARTATLAARYRAGTRRPVIGITWHSEGAPTSRRKAVPLAEWGPIFGAIDATWVDLQYGDPGDARAAAEQAFGVSLLRDPSVDPFNDIDGLAAQIAALDLIVTISTTTVHVAGAVGTPTFVMVPARRGLLWHWFTDRSDSPWYPRVRLFRQTRDGDWSDVVAAVAAALGDWRADRSAPS